MIGLKRNTNCFYCKVKIKKSECYTIQINTSEGLHEVYTCEGCGKRLDTIAKELEEVIDEKPR